MHHFHFLAGGNTAQGFYSCFDFILPKEQQKRMYYIKGGPGVGKSTLMKRFARAAEDKGLEVEYFHCSSDPDSLDGVSLPALGVGMMDGTAPHIYDPVIPGARDTLISLGDFLDEKALLPHVRDIEKVQKQISARFARCYRYLAASEQVLKAAPMAVENASKARKLADEWIAAMPLRGGTGTVRRLFASAFTPRGQVTVADFAPLERCITIECPFGSYATGLMQRLTEGAVRRGLHAIQLLDPLSPKEIAHVIIPAHGLAYCTGSREASSEWLEAAALFDWAGEPEHEQNFDRNACELLWQRATEQLAAAKGLHDELERFYVQNMDFDRWQKVLDGIVEREIG
ncbi:MAG: hypothetical protein IKU70_02140 [Clostridia bacterium]|nr:hypothetical protein [Clostridia bacterium]